MMGKRNSVQRAAGGFTLIELMFAMSVLVIGILATFSSNIGSVNLIKTSRETNTAMSDLRTAMEQVLAMPHDAIPIAGSPFEAGQPVAFFDGLHLENEQIVATYPGYGGGAVPENLEIVLTITFTDYAGRPRSLKMATMVTR